MPLRLSGMEKTILTVKAIRDYEAGFSIKEIAKRHKTTHVTVRKLLVEANVPIKRVGRPHKDYD